MKILGVGLSKTATTSLHRALGILGFKSLHYDERRLNDILDGTNQHPDFRRYDDVDAVLDIPAAYFFEELLQAYPASKCILTVRDEDQWWKSVERHFNQKSSVKSPEENPVKWHIRNYVFGSAIAHEFLFRKRFRQHNEHVIRTVPAERLLRVDFTAGDGWEKLCPFLGISVPDVPFPHQNRQEEYGGEYLNRAIAELIDVVPEKATFIFVDENTIDTCSVVSRNAIPFLERDGVYWGAPANDEDAVRECERLRRCGATHIVFAWPAFWWLDHYAGFRRHLKSQYRCVVHSDRLVAFDFGAHANGCPRT